MNKNKKNLSGYGFSFKDYIKILENPDKIGLNNGIWSAPILKGYDKNQRGYGIDINTNKKAKALTNNRPGRWLTEKEADTLMDDHINYITEAANKHIKGFSELPFRRRWALLGMLYRGDSVNKSGININEPDDLKFFKSISDYYRSKGLNTRANSSDEFFNRPVSKLLSMFKLKNGGQIRKMLTAAGGPLRIKFDPERIARLEYLMTRVPGMNNSGGNRYRKEGILALQHLELEAKRKEEEIKSRMEMRPTLKRKATKAEKLQGKKDEYEQVPLVVGMSGTDPVGEFILAGIGLNGVGTLAKTGLWNVAKYAPATQLGNWGRGYFVGNTFKNSFNGAVPILTPLLTSKNLFRTKVYKGGEIKDPYSNFLTTDPKYAANYGKVTPYIFESKSIAKAKEPMMGSSDPVNMDMFIYHNTKGNPNATAIIGHDAVTGEFIPSKGIEILNMNPKNLYPIRTPNSPTSLKFFERPTLSNTLELAGTTKWERNFKPKWHVANYPGYLLKGLMKGSLLEKQLSKNGTININLLNAYFNKASQIEKEVANKVLAEKFAGQKTIDYNLFKKAVLDELITYERVPLTKYAKYGMDRLGLTNKVEGLFEEGPLVLAGIPQNVPLQEPLSGIKINTFTFESPKITVGNNKHYDPTTLGHSRTYTTPEEPNVLHVMESLSDWGQSHVKMMPSVLAHQIAVEKALKSGNTNAFHSFTNRLGSLLANKLTKYERMALENINKEIESGLPSGFLTIEDLWNKKYEILKKAGNRSNIGVLGLHLHDNYLQRLLQENLRYAAENGLTKMRYPTSETAAKIEGYTKLSPSWELIEVLEKKYNRPEGYVDLGTRENFDFESLPEKEALELSKRFKIYEKWDESQQAKDFWKEFNNIGDYYPQHQTILKKYADFPKLFLKLFKDLQVRTVTDAKGNTWYEVDVPKGYLSREWLFKQGGKMNIIEFLKNGSGIHIKEKNKGKFTSYCGGKVTDECIRKAKASGNPTLVKRATFADNARHFKHKSGGLIVQEFKLRKMLNNIINN